jgi:enoyl-CoA hydratase
MKEQSMYKTLIYEKKDNIGLLTINRPDKLNAISNELTAELRSLLDELEKDNDLRVVIITGAGDKAFVAGADIKELVERDARLGRQVSSERQEIFSRIENLPVPVIAAVNGYALGGGLEIALACNIRICSEKAQFGAPEVKLGIIPGDGGTQRLPRLVGLGRAMEMILTGDFIDAQEAYRIGLVNEVVPPEDLMDKAMELAKKIASRPPLAVRYAKEAVNRSQEGDTASGFALESYLHALTCTTEDKKEGVAAFLEKRKGKFKGK